MSANGQQVSEVRQQFSIDKLTYYLKDKLPNFQGPLIVKQFKLGQSNPTYLLTDSRNQRWVLRKKPPGKLISKKAHAVEREYKVLNQINKFSNVPVPNVFLLCEDVDVIGTPFYVMQFVEGDIHDVISLPNCDNQKKIQIWYSAVETLARLHQVDIHKAGLEDYGPKGNYYPRQIKNLLKLAVQQASTPNVEQLYRFEDLVNLFSRYPIQDEVSIIHGDYKIDNLIFEKNTSKVIGILDWELSTIGNPLFDLSNLLQPFYFLQHGVKSDIDFFIPLHNSPELPKNFRDSLIQHYCKLTNRSYPIKNWNACVAFSFFRLSIIIQGIAARVQRGQASSAKAHVYAKSLKVISKTTVDVLTKDSHL